MKKRILNGILFGIAVGLFCGAGCETENSNSDQMNHSIISSENESHDFSADTNSSETTEEALDEPIEITIDTLGMIADPKDRLAKAQEFYSEVNGNYEENKEDIVVLLKTMAECTYGDSIEIKSFDKLYKKIDELMQIYQGAYSAIPIGTDDVSKDITIYDNEGNKIIDYDAEKDIVKAYGCTSANHINEIRTYGDVRGEIWDSFSTLGFFTGNPYESSGNAEFQHADYFEFEYDAAHKLSLIKWKVYQPKADGSNSNNWKWAWYDLSYRADGYLKEVKRGGNIWGEAKGGEGYEFMGANWKIDYKNQYVEISVLGLEDGSCQFNTINHATEANFIQTHRGVGMQRFSHLGDTNIYYDMISKKILNVYSAMEQDEKSVLLRNYIITYLKNKDKPEIEAILENTGYLIYSAETQNDWDVESLLQLLY